MKLIKLNKKHKLHRYGYTHAFRVNGLYEEQAKIDRVESYLYSAYPEVTLCKVEAKWCTPQGPWATWRPPYNYKTCSQDYWIGFRNEEDATMCLMFAQ